VKVLGVPVAGLLWALSSCGYSTGFDLSSQGIHTVAITVVANESYRQRFERPLTAELQRSIPTFTGASLGSHRSADAILKIVIEDVQGLSIVQGTNQQPIVEGGLVFTVRVELRDRKTGALLRSQQIRDASEFRTPVHQNTKTALLESSRDLARKIALALEPAF